MGITGHRHSWIDFTIKKDRTDGQKCVGCKIVLTQNECDEARAWDPVGREDRMNLAAEKKLRKMGLS
jgi:hypothetical protein